MHLRIALASLFLAACNGDALAPLEDGGGMDAARESEQDARANDVPPEAPVPGPCGPEHPCLAGQLCEGGCSAQSSDVCVDRPQACGKSYAPVCGCDGLTYGNDCERRAAGVRLRAAGSCAPRDGGADGPCAAGYAFCPCTGSCYDTRCLSCCMSCQPDAGAGKLCGGIAGLPCPPSYFCENPAATCNVADGSGECRAIPAVCTAIYAPVCGCDGKTYSNDCVRQGSSVSKDHDGPCP